MEDIDPSERRKLHDLFVLVDADGSGEITGAELTDVGHSYIRVWACRRRRRDRAGIEPRGRCSSSSTPTAAARSRAELTDVGHSYMGHNYMGP